jgi:predicted HAD superfamily phosphohydrolase
MFGNVMGAALEKGKKAALEAILEYENEVLKYVEENNFSNDLIRYQNLRILKLREAQKKL